MGINVLSLFSGCGGLDWGFSSAGFDVVLALDNDPSSVAVHNLNFEGNAQVCDVTSLQFRRLLDQLSSIDVILGGFPCQGFSKAGPKQRDDPRNSLFQEMSYAVETLRPRLFIAENVDGLAQNYKGEFLSLIVSTFAAIGYRVEHRIIDAAAYGVPQHRRRTIFVGIREDLAELAFSWPTPTHVARRRNGERSLDLPLFDWATYPETLRRESTIADAIGDLVELDPAVPDHNVVMWPSSASKIMERISQGQKLCDVRFGPASVHTWDIPDVYGIVSERERQILETIAMNRRHKAHGDTPNGNALSISVIEELSGLVDIEQDVAHLQNLGYLKRSGTKLDIKGATFCSGIFKRPKWDEPSPTVLTNFHNPRYFVHPLRDRPFSARECARLQSFPDSFKFSSPEVHIPTLDKYRLIGNAVPPLLATAIACEVFKTLGG